MQNLNQHNNVWIQNINIYNPNEKGKANHRRVQSQNFNYNKPLVLQTEEKLDPYFSINSIQAKQPRNDGTISIE